MKTLFNHIYQKIKEVNFEENELCKLYWLKLERLKSNFTDEAGLELLFENIEWLISSGVVTGEELKRLGNLEKMRRVNIYFDEEVEIKDSKAILFGTSKATVSGHSLVRCFDDTLIEADDSTFVTAFHNSTVIAKNCKVIAFNKAKVISKGLCLIENYTEGGVIESTSRDLVY